MKASVYTIICGTAMAVLSLGSRNYSETLEEVKKTITQSNEMYFQAFVKNDPSGFAERYTEDCWIMLPNTPVMSGPSAPRDFFSFGYNQFGVRNGKRITIDVYGITEDIVAEVGFWKLIPLKEGQNTLIFTLKTPDGKTIDHTFAYNVKKGQTLFHTFSSLESNYPIYQNY